jgi:flagellar assembly protein FliH
MEKEETPVESVDSEDIRAKLEIMEREAYEKGFEQGQKDGLALEKTRLDEMGRQVEELFSELRDLKIQIYHESEEEILKLAMAVARKIIGEEVRTNVKIVQNSIKSALKFLTDKRKVRIIINPEDMEETKRMLPDLSRLTRGGNFQLTENSAIDRGGCVLETGFGKINARIDDQLKGLEEVILGEFLHGEGVVK